MHPPAQFPDTPSSTSVSGPANHGPSPPVFFDCKRGTKLYRYSDSAYNAALIVMGVARIGTLYDFRNNDHRRGIADPSEGKKTVVEHVSETTLVQEVEVPDCFIFCGSSSLSRETMRQFEGADSCVSISDIDGFFSLLTEVINDFVQVKFGGVMPVTYQRRQEPYNGVNGGRHPAVIKEPRYSAQCEVRALWMPKAPKLPIQPLVVGDWRLGRYCRPEW